MFQPDFAGSRKRAMFGALYLSVRYFSASRLGILGVRQDARESRSQAMRVTYQAVMI
jgi:hypothetical protein